MGAVLNPEKWAHRLGFTYVEFKVMAILLLLFAAGLAIKYFSLNDPVYIRYHGVVQDSLDEKTDSLLFFRSAPVLQEYKKEALVTEKRVFRKKVLPAEKSINLNTAGLAELMQLPGIGEKTALKILDLRKKKGYFRRPEDLKEVKGIQDKKLKKIIKYIYIE